MSNNTFQHAQESGNRAYESNFRFYHMAERAADAYHAAYNCVIEIEGNRIDCNCERCEARRKAIKIDFAQLNAQEAEARQAGNDAFYERHQ